MGFFFVLHTKPVFPQYKRKKTLLLVSLVIFPVSFAPTEHPSSNQVHDCFSPFFTSWVCIPPRVFMLLQLHPVRGKPLTKCRSSFSWFQYLAKFFRSSLFNFYSCQSVKKAEPDVFCLNWVCYFLLTRSQKPVTPFSTRNIYTDLIISCDYSWCKKTIAMFDDS